MRHQSSYARLNKALHAIYVVVVYNLLNLRYWKYKTTSNTKQRASVRVKFYPSSLAIRRISLSNMTPWREASPHASKILQQIPRDYYGQMILQINFASSLRYCASLQVNISCCYLVWLLSGEFLCRYVFLEVRFATVLVEGTQLEAELVLLLRYTLDSLDNKNE